MKKKDNWILIVFILTFILSFLFSTISNLLSDINIIVMIIILLLVIFIGIIFDMIGVAVLSCNEASFHAKASNKIKGAKECIKLIKNSNKTSSICNDVIGDVCGIISGSLTVSLAILLKDTPIVDIILTAIVSSITVGCKAISKKIAIKHSDDIVFVVGNIISKFKVKKRH
jgi:Mg2+/Co2+ transporter CorB